MSAQVQRTYYHPVVGGGWPTVPPNFLAYRWGNARRQLNRVTSYEVAFLSERFPGVKDDYSAASRPPEEAHGIYQLGPDIPLPEGIPSGPGGLNLRAQRFWVLLDQLLTQPTPRRGKRRHQRTRRHLRQPLPRTDCGLRYFASPERRSLQLGENVE